MKAQRKLAYPVSLVIGLICAQVARGGQCQERRIAVNVYTDQGGLVKGLSAPYFRASVNGKAVKVISATFDTSPRRIVIVVDAGSSTKTSWPPALKAVEGLLNSSPQDSFALLIYKTSIEKQIGFGANPADIASELKSPAWARWPEVPSVQAPSILNDALMEAVKMLQPAKLGDAIYLVSSGEDQRDRAGHAQVESALLQTGIRLFVFTPPGTYMEYNVDSMHNAPLGIIYLTSLMRISGGDSITWYSRLVYGSTAPRPRPPIPNHPALDIDNTSQITAAAGAGFAEEINGFYNLQLDLTAPLKKSGNLKLELVDSNGKEWKTVDLVYPSRLSACD